MKNFNYLSLVIIALFTACNKDATIKNDPFGNTLESRSPILTENEAILRQWTEWSMRIDPANDPGLDPDGTLTMQNQPYVPGILFLAGANSPDFVERTIIVSLSNYQKLFFPLLAAFWWNYACDPLAKNDNGKLAPGTVNSQALFNGKDHELDFKWDGVQFASTIPKPLYVNGGIWPTEIHPAYYEYCNLVKPVDMHIEAMVIQLPLTLGDHTLECKGSMSSGKYHQLYFSNHVKYNIHVIP